VPGEDFFKVDLHSKISIYYLGVTESTGDYLGSQNEPLWEPK
jgi:hypothetical protein